MNTVEINCAKGQTPMRVHPPIATRSDNSVCSSFIIVPSWSIDERICPSCGMMNAPVIAPQVSYGWAAFEAPKEIPRIVVPKLGPVSIDVQRKFGQG